MIVHAFTCDHSPRLVCDWCDGNLILRQFWENGRLHRHEDGTVHRHEPPYQELPHGPVVAFLDNGPTLDPGPPEAYAE